jgi:hypothetical protein
VLFGMQAACRELDADTLTQLTALLLRVAFEEAVPAGIWGMPALQVGPSSFGRIPKLARLGGSHALHMLCTLGWICTCLASEGEKLTHQHGGSCDRSMTHADSITQKAVCRLPNSSCPLACFSIVRESLLDDAHCLPLTLQELSIAGSELELPLAPPHPAQQLTRLSLRINQAASISSHLMQLTSLRTLSLHGAASTALSRQHKRELLHALCTLPALRLLRLSKGIIPELRQSFSLVPEAALTVEDRRVRIAAIRELDP